MKKIMLLFVAGLLAYGLKAQDRTSIGVGYFGHNITHPGIVVQAEHARPIGGKFLMPLRLAAGAYSHQRSHNAVFAEFGTGVRYRPGRFYAGIGGGLGLMASWYNSDLGVFEVDAAGNITEVSNAAGIDFMPSINLEAGYTILSNDQYDFTVWARPRAFWQYPHNERLLFHYATEIGISIQFSSSNN